MKILEAQILITALAVQIVCQLFKLIYYSIKGKQFSLKYFVSPGGMPSAHTAFVCALTTALGLKNGFSSDIFTLSAVFSLIIIYDAYRLRGIVQKHSIIINSLVSSEKRVTEMVGHSLMEIFIGFCFGTGTALFVNSLF